MNNIKDIILKQKNYYLSGETKDINFRIDNLKKLKRLIKENEEIILDALKKDLGKSNFEGYITEIGMAVSYTHLDVYKRQVLIISMRISLMQRCYLDIFNILSCKKLFINGYMVKIE